MPRVARGPENAAAFRDRENPLLAEDVAEGSEPAARHLGDHFFHHLVEIPLPVGAVLDRHLVRPHEGGHHGDRVLLRGEADRFERPQLGRGLEAVAALHLGRGGAAEQHLVEASDDGGGQLFARRRAGGLDRPYDAPAGRGDVLVGRTGQAPHDLVVTIAGKGQVGVGVDEAGNDRAAAGVQHPFGRDVYLGLEVGVATDPDDAALGRGQGRVRQGAELAEARANARDRSREGRQEADLADREVGARSRSTLARARQIETREGLLGSRGRSRSRACCGWRSPSRSPPPTEEPRGACPRSARAPGWRRLRREVR